MRKKNLEFNGQRPGRSPGQPSRRQSPAWLAPAAVLVFTLILYGVLTAASRSRSGILEDRHLDRDG